MKVQLPVMLAAVVLMSACTGMHQYLVEDAEIAREGSKMAVLDTCVARGLASGERISRYRQAQLQLLSVSVHNRELYERRYAEQRDATAGRPTDALAPLCQRAGAGLADATVAMQRQYLEASSNAASGTRAATGTDGATAAAVGPITAVRPNDWAPKP